MSDISEFKSEFEKDMEMSYTEAPANLSGCVCHEEHRLHMALAETRARPVVFAPERRGIEDAYCATFGRRCGCK